jgi:CBS domain-containing protein
MVLQEILSKKGTQVFMIAPHATVDEAVQRLVEDKIGSLIVCEGEASSQRILGIITERDVLHTLAAHRGSLAQLRVSEVMTADLVVVSPRHTTVQAMGLMTEHRIRHLPVVADGVLCGIVSIGDLVKAHHEMLEQDNYYMKSYIQGGKAEPGSQPRPR